MTRMHKGRYKFASLFLALALVAGACGGDDDDEATGSGDGGSTESTDAPVEQEELDITMGASTAGSSVFAFLTAHARLAADADGDMTVNVRETNASSENIQLVNDGAVQFGISSWELSYLAQQGLGTYEGKALPKIQNIMNYLLNGEVLLVRADSGIDSVSDLDGKAFAPSFQGSSVYQKFVTIFEFLGIEIDAFTGSLEDITNAVKDGRIVGFGKSANGVRPDASMLDTQSAVAMKPIGFSDEELEKLAEEFPYYEFTDIEAGFLGDSEPFRTTAIYSDYIVSSDMSEDDAYRLTKALWESIDEAAEQSNYDGARGRKPDETIATMDLMDIHPGALKYYEEIGAL